MKGSEVLELVYGVKCCESCSLRNAPSQSASGTSLAGVPAISGWKSLAALVNVLGWMKLTTL